MSDLSRRSIVASAAALPALAVPAIAMSSALDLSPDVVLRQLWSEYLVVAEACNAVAEKYAIARAAYEAELPPCPDDVSLADHYDNHEWLWQKHGIDPLSDAANDAHDKMRDMVRRILGVEACSLFGIGVKLAAVPAGIRLDEGRSCDAGDYGENVASVLANINRLTGSNFFVPEYDYADDEDDEAVQS
jgi:hypothetical protein